MECRASLVVFQHLPSINACLWCNSEPQLLESEPVNYPIIHLRYSIEGDIAPIVAEDVAPW